MGKKSSDSSNDGSDEAEKILKSKKKIQKPKSPEKKDIKKLMKSIDKLAKECEELQKILPSNTDLQANSQKEKEFECCFSGPEAHGPRWGNNCQSIFVEGFDSSLPRGVIKSSLSKHFGSCGEVKTVFVPMECKTGVVLGFAFINLKDENDIKNALTLDGSDLGGRKLEVVMAKDKVEYFCCRFPNFKGCGICNARDIMTRFQMNYHQTFGGRVQRFPLEPRSNP